MDLSNLLFGTTSKAAEANPQTAKEPSEGKAKKLAIHITEQLRPIVLKDSGKNSSTLLGWKQSENVGPWRRGCLVYYNKTIYIIGGDYEGKASEDVYALNLEKPERGFRYVEFLKCPRRLAAAVVYKDQIQITGGHNEENILNSCESLITPNSRDDGHLPSSCRMITARHSHGMLVYQGSLYVLGGIGERGNVLRSVEKYNESSSTWRESAPMLFPRAEFSLACTKNNNKIFLVGGCTDSEVEINKAVDINVIHMLNISTGLLTNVASTPFIQLALASFVMEDECIHVFGKPSKKSTTTMVVRYGIKSGTWMKEVVLITKDVIRPWSLIGIEDIDVSEV